MSFPAFSSPAFSTPAYWSRNFKFCIFYPRSLVPHFQVPSRIFHPCILVPHFPVLHFPYLQCGAAFSGLAFSLFSVPDRVFNSSLQCTSNVVSWLLHLYLLRLLFTPTRVAGVKPGFHYPSWRPELTARVDGWPVSITRQHGPCLPTESSTTFLPFIRPSNVILSDESCLRIWPNHLFCRLLRVSIISFFVSTICNTSSFVLCSVHDTFITRLHIECGFAQVANFVFKKYDTNCANVSTSRLSHMRLSRR